MKTAKTIKGALKEGLKKYGTPESINCELKQSKDNGIINELREIKKELIAQKKLTVILIRTTVLSSGFDPKILDTLNLESY